MEKLLIYREKILNFLSSHWQVCDREPDEELTRLFCELAGEEERP